MKFFDIKSPRLREKSQSDSPESQKIITADSEGQNGRLISLLITAGIILAGIIIVAIFRADINNYAIELMHRYGNDRIDVILFLATAVSSSPICLPVWQYVLVGIAMGYDIPRLAVIMALGSASGSLITYVFGRYFGRSRFVAKRFPKAREHPWVHGRSKWYVTLALFLGTVSPIPFDILYFACGVKKYPPLLLYITCASARVIRYLYIGYGFDLFSAWL